MYKAKIAELEAMNVLNKDYNKATKDKLLET